MTASGRWKFERLVLSRVKILPLQPFSYAQDSLVSLRAEGLFRFGWQKGIGI